MKIALIYPLLSEERSRVDENKQYWAPLGLAYIAAVLRESGHLVQIIDRDLLLRKNKFDFNKTDEITLGLIKDFDTQIVGFSATTPNISDVDIFSRKIKKKFPDILNVLGGHHCTGEPTATIGMCTGIDIIARGEGEFIMLDIVNNLPIDKIEGITYRSSAGLIESNPDRPLLEPLDILPFPARDLLDMQYYTRPSRFISRNLSLRATHVFTARGCPYNCNYCAGPLMGRRRVRYHSPERVLLEMQDLIDKYSVEAIYFAEDMFLSDKSRAKRIMDLFIENRINKKIVWMAQINPNAVTSELLDMLKEGGCVHLEYGFESGSQRMLNLMNKKTNINNNKKTAILTKKKGLRFQGNFITGYPGETEEDFNKTISFIKEVRPNNIALNIFMPLPGTGVYKKLKEENKLLDNWDDVGNPDAPNFNYADMPKETFDKLFYNAKIKVVLPINFVHFLKDNIYHPFRLLYVASTQFRGVIIRLCNSVLKLRNMRNKNKP